MSICISPPTDDSPSVLGVAVMFTKPLSLFLITLPVIFTLLPVAVMVVLAAFTVPPIDTSPASVPVLVLLILTSPPDTLPFMLTPPPLRRTFPAFSTVPLKVMLLLLLADISGLSPATDLYSLAATKFILGLLVIMAFVGRLLKVTPSATSM